jgi:hypothetical protein
MAPDDDDDPKVKQLLNPATEEDLARWFNLPSFTQLAEQQTQAPATGGGVDAELQAVIERRDQALANVDPHLLESLYFRNETRPASLLKFKAMIDIQVDQDFGNVDEDLVARKASIAEERSVEISEQVQDDLKECTPQALLRDLHRAELYFDKTYEIVDIAAEQRLDIVAEVRAAMATSWKLPPLSASPLIESTALFAAVRAQRRRTWTEFLPELPNRRETE